MILSFIAGIVAGAVPTFFITKNSPAHAATVNAAADKIVATVQTAVVKAVPIIAAAQAAQAPAPAAPKA